MEYDISQHLIGEYKVPTYNPAFLVKASCMVFKNLTSNNIFWHSVHGQQPYSQQGSVQHPPEKQQQLQKLQHPPIQQPSSQQQQHPLCVQHPPTQHPPPSQQCWQQKQQHPSPSQQCWQQKQQHPSPSHEQQLPEQQLQVQQLVVKFCW